MNKCLLAIFGLMMSLACAASETTDDPRISQILGLAHDPAFGEYLAAGCAACHLDTGNNQGIADIQQLTAEEIIVALLAYRDGERSNATMQSVAVALSDEEIGALASHFGE